MKKNLLVVTFAALIAAPVVNLQAQWNTNGSSIYYNGGNIGIGTNSPQSLLELAGPGGVSTLTFTSPGNELFRFGTIPSIPNWGAVTLNGGYVGGSGWYLDDTSTPGWFFKLDNRGGTNTGLWLWEIPAGANPHTNESAQFGVTVGYAWSGQAMGIGTTLGATPDSELQVVGNSHITGNVTVDGNIAAKYQDVAEWVPASEDMKPGTVVVVDPSGQNRVVSSSRAYQTSVAGVVSADPGVILGVAAEDKAKIATTGRVLVRVDATHAPIRPGDLLVTSDEPGIAMRSKPVDVGGVKIHRPGTILGKALEPLASGKGEILALLSLQ